MRKYSNGRVVIARSPSPYPNALQQPGTDATDQSTCSCFTIAHCADPFSKLNGPGSSSLVSTTVFDTFGELESERILETIISDFLTQYQNISRNADDPNPQVRDVEMLPNSYNSPIHLSGYAAALKGLDRNLDVSEVNLGSLLASEIAAWLKQGDGSIYDVLPSTPRNVLADRLPNAYLTYWCVRGLSDWLELMSFAEFESYAIVIDHEVAAFRSALYSALETAKNRLARILAAAYSSIHDSVDLCCALAVVGLLARRLRHEDEETLILIEGGIQLLFQKYVLGDGSIVPKAAVLTTRTGYSLVLSTPELAAILVHGLGRLFPNDAIVALDPIVDGIIRRRSGARGWGSSVGASPLRRLAFVSSAALSFLRTYRELLNVKIADDNLHQIDAAVYMPIPSSSTYGLPQSICADIENWVIGPLRSRDLQHTATTTFVLAGPPTRVKFEVVSRIAHDLKWPLLVLPRASTSDTNGKSGTGQTANLLCELTKVVILIEATGPNDPIVENLLDRLRQYCHSAARCDEREHRFHRLVLAIDLNDAESRSPSMRIAGQPIRVFDVKMPAEEERRKVIERELQMSHATDSLRNLLRDCDYIKLTSGLTVEDICRFVRACCILDQIAGSVTPDAISRELQHVRSDSVY